MKKQKKTGTPVRQKRYMVFGILCVVSLFGIAMIIPDYYSRLYDRRTLNRIAFTDTRITTYEASYDSFREKLHAIAKGWSQKSSELRAVRTNELEQGMDQDELTKIVGDELKKLYEYKIVHKKIKPKKKNLLQCERYTVYETKETEGMKGISIWKLVYENGERTVTVYLDEEYHKIYYLKLAARESEKNAKGSVSVDKARSGTKVYDSAGSSYYDDLPEHFIRNYWYLIMQYYRTGIYDNWVENNTAGVVEFDSGYQITFLYDYSLDGSQLIIGIPMEKMIQF